MNLDLKILRQNRLQHRNFYGIEQLVYYNETFKLKIIFVYSIP